MSIKNGEDEQTNEEPRRYFAPGELIVAVEHPSDIKKEDLYNKLTKNPVLVGQQDDPFDQLLTELQKYDIDKKTLAIVQVAQRKAAGLLADANWVREALKGAPEPIRVRGRGIDVSTSFVSLNLNNLEDTTLIYLAGELELRLKPPTERGEPQIRGVCLDWLWSSAPDNLTTGGPGSLPVEPSDPENITEDDLSIIVWDDSFFSSILKKPDPTSIERRGKLRNKLHPPKKRVSHPCRVEVVILDTIPPEEALKEWRSNSCNPFLSKLIKNPNGVLHDGVLHRYPESKTDFAFNAPDPAHQAGIVGYPYDMSDHGLFIASIIYKQADKAGLHLIEVLNKNGVGSSRALIWGLAQIVENPGFDNALLIINSSLTIGFSCETIKSLNQELTPPERMLCAVHKLEDESRLSASSSIQFMYEKVTKTFKNSISVAAAGNDNRAENDGEFNSQGRALARFPAAYGSVIGVGALTRKGEVARYSNKPDVPESEGFYVFGGDVDRRQDEKDKDSKWIASKTDGILGVYTHCTYPGEEEVPNTSGWARWAGTSFASAVVTGILAQIAECEAEVLRPTGHKATIKFLRTVANEKEPGGHVLPVKQGRNSTNPGKA